MGTTGITWDQLELPWEATATAPASACRSTLGTFAECPMCGHDLAPEHAHYRCASCGWRDSCCD